MPAMIKSWAFPNHVGTMRQTRRLQKLRKVVGWVLIGYTQAVGPKLWDPNVPVEVDLLSVL